MSARAVVETQSPEQQQPWVEADSFFDLDDALDDGVRALDGRLRVATAVRVRVAGETAWVGVVNAAGEVVNAPPLPPLTSEILWDVAWEGDDPRFMFQASDRAPKYWLALASVRCAALAADAVKPAGARRRFETIVGVIEQWAKDDAYNLGSSAVQLYEAWSSIFETRRRYRLSAASRAAFDALEEITVIRAVRYTSPLNNLFRLPGHVTAAAGAGLGKKARQALDASLEAQMAAIVRSWISLGVAMESSL